VSKRDHTVLPATHTFIHKWNEPYMHLLPSRRASPAKFGWYSFYRLTEVEGLVDLGGWSHAEIKCRPRELNPDTVTHPSINQVQRMLTTLMESNALPLRQTMDHADTKLIQPVVKPIEQAVECLYTRHNRLSCRQTFNSCPTGCTNSTCLIHATQH